MSRLRPHVPLLLALMLGLGGLGRWTLWQDEAFTWWVVQRDLAGIVEGAANDRHPPLYYLLCAALRWMGDRDFVYRLPAALGYIAAVPLVAAAGRRHVGARAGEVAAFVVALCPVAVMLAHTARMYGLLLGLGAALLTSALALCFGPRPGRAAVGLGLAAAAAIWTHYAAAAAIVSVGMGVLAALPGRPQAGRRLGLLLLAGLGAGLSFLPWAMGPLGFQLGAKDSPAERTVAVLGYLGWAFDSRVPAWSWLLAGLQLLGLGVVGARVLGWWREAGEGASPERRALARFLAAAAVGMGVLPWLASRSLPAQNPRNYLDLLPLAALIVGVGVQAAQERWGRALGPLALVAVGLLSMDPLTDLLRRPTSPQEPGPGFDYQVEADVLAASIPPNGSLRFRPGYLLLQYERYAPELGERVKARLDRRTWLGMSRGEWLDSTVQARYPEACTVRTGMRFVLYAPEGPGCEALQVWLTEVAAAEGYVPFLQELARRERDAGHVDGARALAERAVKRSWWHAGPWLLLAELRLADQDLPGAAEAAERALSITRRWHAGGPAIGEAFGMIARVEAARGDAAAAAAARASADCARSQELPTLCGTALEPWIGRFATVTPPAPVYPPLPALSEGQLPPPPAEPPAGAERLALWPFDGEVLPEGWSDVSGRPDAPAASMEEEDGRPALVVANAEGLPTALACGPAVPSAQRVSVRGRWRSRLGSGEGRTSFAWELRFLDEQGEILRVGGVPALARPLWTASATEWRVDRFDVRAPPGAARVRACVKVDGTVPGRLVVDWLELSGSGS